MNGKTENYQELLDSLIGMTEDEGRILCKENGYESRVVRIDSRHCIITCDMHMDRVNFELDNGIITKCEIF